MPYVQTNGINLYYELHGNGEPLVLIPGISYSGWMWHKMIMPLAEHFEVISIDNRGAGQSEKPAGPYSAQMLAADVAGLLDAFDLPQAHILGHSMGGFVAQALALDFPERVDKLILAATNFGGPRHVPVSPEAMAVLTDMSIDPLERLRRGIAVSCAPGFAEANPAFINEWVKHRLENPIDPGGYQAQLAIGLGLLAESAAFESRLGNVTASTLLLFAAEDKVVPPENAALMAELIPDATVAILPDAGHFFPFETPAAAVDVVVAFLES